MEIGLHRICIKALYGVRVITVKLKPFSMVEHVWMDAAVVYFYCWLAVKVEVLPSLFSVVLYWCIETTTKLKRAFAKDTSYGTGIFCI